MQSEQAAAASRTLSTDKQPKQKERTTMTTRTSIAATRKIGTDATRSTLRVVVIGGTGLIGSKLVAKLKEHGHDAIPASPNSGVNTLTGEGLAEVLTGASVVVDVSNSPSFADASVMSFFETSTRNVLAAEKDAGVWHHVALSVVGADRLQESGYMRAKMAQERLIRSSSIPYSIVRATQFFEFIKAIGDAATEGNTVRVAPALFQPMAADDVVIALEKTASGAPLNALIEVSGPEQFRIDDLVRRALAVHNDPREVVADPRARYFDAVLGVRTLLPGDGARFGATTLKEWLGRQATRQ